MPHTPPASTKAATWMRIQRMRAGRGVAARAEMLPVAPMVAGGVMPELDRTGPSSVAVTRS